MDLQPSHDSDDPLAHLNAIEAVWLASDRRITHCPHCTVVKRMLPMSGNGWGVELWHEASCPENVENHPRPGAARA